MSGNAKQEGPKQEKPKGATLRSTLLKILAAVATPVLSYWLTIGLPSRDETNGPPPEPPAPVDAGPEAPGPEEPPPTERPTRPGGQP
jgi:hypothetical protein